MAIAHTKNKNYEEIARNARRTVLNLIYRAQTSHIGSNFSIADILAVLFEKVDIKKDEVILSAGWKAAIWYYFLWRKGIISEEELNSFCQLGSKFIGLVEPMNRWGLRFAGGSMGYGLPFGVGVALAKKTKKEKGNVYVIMSDGEINCGTTWESLWIAAHHKLDNLCIIIDMNGLQAMGKTKDILDNKNLGNKLKGFNWLVTELDGHDHYEIRDGIDNINDSINVPKAIIANTIKGRGVKIFEGNNLWHYWHINKEIYEEALAELR